MGHRRTYRPLVARIPGGADHPVATADQFPPLPSAVDVTVGVVDTGIVVDADRRPHPWFADHLAFREQDIDPIGVGRGDDDERGFLARADGHGTFVAGLILREAPRARVTMWGVIDRVDDEIDDPDDTLGPVDDVAVADAVRALARDLTVQVVNLSFGGGTFVDAGAAGDLEAALATLDSGVAVVAAAGNDADKAKVWPAAFPGVIAVGALDENRWRPRAATPPLAAFTNYGDWVTAYAGGVQVLGPFVYSEETAASDDSARPPQRFDGWARWSGTSFAAARVSGRIAQTAIELGVSGTEAAEIVLRESRSITPGGGVWVRGTS